MYAVVLFLYTVWESHGVFYFSSRFLCFKRPIKKIRINSKIPCPQSPSFLVQRPRRQREAKRAMGTTMTRTVESLSRPLRKFAVVADLEVPVSPTSTTGLFMLTISSSSHVVLTVSTVGTKISENFFSGS